jgi:hypothetical protein
MAELDQLQAQARKCRVLASGLSNDDDIRALEELARELEAKARLIRHMQPPADRGVMF